MRPDAVWCGIALAALLVLPAPASSQDRPVFPPVRDVAVTYKATLSQPGTPPELLLRYSAAADRFRVEGGLPGYVLVDHKSRHASIVMERLGVMMDAPRRAGLDQALLLENASRFARAGNATVAGLRCTVWDVAGDAATGTACVTADGVVLRASGRDRMGRTGDIEAIRVEYGRQAEALFFPPSGLRTLDLAGGPGGGGQGLSGLLSGPGVAAVLGRLRGQQP